MQYFCTVSNFLVVLLLRKSHMVQDSGRIRVRDLSLTTSLYRMWGCPKGTNESTVEPTCKVRGVVQQKLTIQEGFCCLTLQPNIIIKNMIIWDLLELTLHPF